MCMLGNNRKEKGGRGNGEGQTDLKTSFLVHRKQQRGYSSLDK